MRTRAVGAVHNISSEAEAIRIIRRLHAIGPLVELLRTPNATVCGSAAGALQNLSRESHARDEIHELGAVVLLTDLLFGDDVQAQVGRIPERPRCARDQPDASAPPRHRPTRAVRAAGLRGGRDSQRDRS